jgi:hypothetical protein
MKVFVRTASGTFDSDVQAYDPFNERATFEYKTSFIPRKCYTTKKWVWGLAVRGRRIITGPGEPVVEDRWYHRHEAILMMLKGLKEN